MGRRGLARLHESARYLLKADALTLAGLVTLASLLKLDPGVANVGLQVSLPAATDYGETNEGHTNVRRLIDSTAADFAHMAGILERVDASRIAQSAYPHLLADARDNWRPYVRTAEQTFRSREAANG